MATLIAVVLIIYLTKIAAPVYPYFHTLPTIRSLDRIFPIHTLLLSTFDLQEKSNMCTCNDCEEDQNLCNCYRECEGCDDCTDWPCCDYCVVQ
jgi:hypothetical protein